MRELVEALKKPESPKGDTHTLAFIMRIQNQDLFAHISIPPLHAYTEDLTTKYYYNKRSYW